MGDARNRSTGSMRVALAIGAVCSAWHWGCSSFDRKEEGPIRISLTVAAESVSPPASVGYPGLAEIDPIVAEHFVARGHGAFPREASGEVQRTTIARAAARRDALRRLGNSILGFRPQGSQAIEEIMRRERLETGALEACLESQSEISFEESENGVEAEARLSGAAVFEALRVAYLKKKAGGATPVKGNARTDPEARRDSIRRFAVEEARKRLLVEILRTRVRDEPVMRRVARDPALGERIEALVREIEPVEVAFGPEGSCRVVLELERERLMRTLR